MPLGDDKAAFYLMCEGPHGDTKSSCETEVSEFQSISPSVDQEVLWLQVTMQYSMGMAISNSPQDLIKKSLTSIRANLSNHASNRDLFLTSQTTLLQGQLFLIRLSKHENNSMTQSKSTKISPYFDQARVFGKFRTGVHVFL